MPTPIDYVDPFIGTGEDGHTFPGATRPHGMVQATPVGPEGGWGRAAGYNYADATISGFAHTALSGPGTGDLLDIILIPGCQTFSGLSEADGLFPERPAYAFQHERESAGAGIYSVTFDESEIQAELTATARSGMHRYRFPKQQPFSILLDLGDTRWTTQTVSGSMKWVDETTLIGERRNTGWGLNRRVCFAIQWEHPLRGVRFADDQRSFYPEETRIVGGIAPKALIEIGPKALQTGQAQLKIGLSTVSPQAALRNLQSENPGWNFDQIHQEAREDWSRILDRLTIEGTEDQKIQFYTAHYHANIAPSLISDVDGSFRDARDGIRHSERPTYSSFSLWDTFRATHPLQFLTSPEYTEDIIRSMLEHYEVYGTLPIWAFWANDNWCMTGYHAVTVMTDAWLKGQVSEELKEQMLTAMRNTSTPGNHFLPLEELEEQVRKLEYTSVHQLPMYLRHGYIPFDAEHEANRSYGLEINRSVVTSIEWGFNDWCIARFAENIGQTELAAEYDKRSYAFEKLFDPASGFLRPRNADGKWLEPFDPDNASKKDSGFTEGSSWQYSWFYPQRMETLVDLMGGKDAVEKKLDSFFEDEFVFSEDTYRGITGMVGKHAQGNEPSHHVPFLYNLTDHPEKSQKLVRHILTTLYHSGNDGISGNEDLGQLSAWFVFAMLGLYPVNPVAGEYFIVSPSVESATLHHPDGSTFKLIVHNQAPDNHTIAALSLDGQPLENLRLPYEALRSNSCLEVTLQPDAP